MPELQRVDEYSAKFGQAEQRKTSALPSLKRQAKEVKKIFFPNPGKQFSRLKSPSGFSASDEEDLLESSGSSTNSQNERIATPGSLLPSPLQTPNQRQQNPIRKSSSTILKSEVEELDQSIKHLVKNPKEEVIDNIRKRHGISRSPSLDSNVRLNSPPDVTSVTPGRTPTLGRATFLNPERDGSASSSRRRSYAGSPAMNHTSKILAEEQAHIDQAISKLKSNSEKLSALAIDSSPMPDIKASFAIKGGKKDSLQPLPLTEKKKKKSKKKLSLSKSLGLSSSKSPLSTSSSGSGFGGNPLDESLAARSSRLPAIDKRVPQIKIDATSRTRRDPNNERRRQGSLDLARRPNLQKPVISSSQDDGMISFDGLERPFSAGPDETFDDVENALADVPSDVLDDLPAKTFEEIPDNVFDAIPAAVTEREAARLKRKEAEMSAERKKREIKESEKKLVDASETNGTNNTGSNSLDSSQNSAASIFLNQRDNTDDGRGDILLQPSTEAPEVGGGKVEAVSLITALFPNAAVSPRLQEQNQVESDFMFALFIQEQENVASNSPNPGRPSPPRPDPDDPDVGHFCAPFSDGFCEANFCIFHNPAPSAPIEGEQ